MMIPLVYMYIFGFQQHKGNRTTTLQLTDIFILVKYSCMYLNSLVVSFDSIMVYSLAFHSLTNTVCHCVLLGLGVS